MAGLVRTFGQVNAVTLKWARLACIHRQCNRRLGGLHDGDGDGDKSRRLPKIEYRHGWSNKGGQTNVVWWSDMVAASSGYAKKFR